jgi:pilus assembly protein Flp/PilA
MKPILAIEVFSLVGGAFSGCGECDFVLRSSHRGARMKPSIAAHLTMACERARVCLRRFAYEGYGAISMKRLARRIATFVECEGGPSAVEYAVMLALIVALCLPTIAAMAPYIRGTMTRLALAIHAKAS